MCAHIGSSSCFLASITESYARVLCVQSGFPRELTSELHGNIFTEICTNCGKEYVRDYDVRGVCVCVCACV